MKSRNSPPTLLFTLLFALTCAGTAGLTVWAAETKTLEAKPGRNAKTTKTEGADNAAPADDKRPPLKISVDRKPINRDAPDRVSYAPVIKRTAASVVYVYSSKTVRAQDFSQFFNDPMLRRFFDVPGVVPPSDDDETPPPRE